MSQYESIKNSLKERKEQAEAILNADADNYDGADGARIISEICGDALELIDDLETKQPEPNFNLIDFLKKHTNSDDAESALLFGMDDYDTNMFITDQEWFAMGKGPTVAEACKDYETDLERKGLKQ